MTADVELLPLPEPMRVLGTRGKDAAEAWCRANVSHSTAAKDAEIAQLEKANEQLHAHGERMHAEIEALRKERDRAVEAGEIMARHLDTLEPRAERLAEALRDGKQIVDEFLQCASIGRPHGKLIAQAKDWLADADAALAQQPAAVTEEMVERATMALLGKSHDTAPGIDWRCDRAWTVNKVRKHMRAALTAALAGQPGGSDNDR